MKKKLLTIGLMSGTSLDGVDAALILTDGINDIKICGELLPKSILRIKGAQSRQEYGFTLRIK